jgi:hypothetical protein
LAQDSILTLTFLEGRDIDQPGGFLIATLVKKKTRV